MLLSLQTRCYVFPTTVLQDNNIKNSIQSELSQKEKNKYHVLTYTLIYVIWKNTDDPICQAGIETQRTYIWIWWGGEGDKATGKLLYSIRSQLSAL